MKGSWWLSWLGLSLSLLNNTPLWPGFLLDGRLDGLGLVNRLVMPCPRLLLFLCSLSVLLVVVLSHSLLLSTFSHSLLSTPSIFLEGDGSWVNPGKVPPLCGTQLRVCCLCSPETEALGTALLHFVSPCWAPWWVGSTGNELNNSNHG